jgi:hypothetical protein
VEPQDLRPGSVASAATRPPRRRSRLVVATCIRVPSRRPLVFSKSIPSSLRASRIKAQGSRRSNLVRLEARYDRKHGFYEYGFGRNGCCLYASERSIVQTALATLANGARYGSKDTRFDGYSGRLPCSIYSSSASKEISEKRRLRESQRVIKSPSLAGTLCSNA